MMFKSKERKKKHPGTRNKQKSYQTLASAFERFQMTIGFKLTISKLFKLGNGAYYQPVLQHRYTRLMERPMMEHVRACICSAEFQTHMQHYFKEEATHKFAFFHFLKTCVKFRGFADLHQLRR